ncbi:MAG: hypothetical protein F6K31_06405, partial [Symploca sp. SIO2G7]|nr:hypothetical protein [Symploca sp. SIO2G7]
MLKLRRPKKVILISSGIFLMRLIGYLPPMLLMGAVGYLSSILVFMLAGYLFPESLKTQQTSPAPSPVASSPTSPEPIIKKVTQSSISPQVSPPISKNGAGLGDRRASFETVHGFNLGDDQSGRYKNDYLNVAYDNDTAYYISLLFEQTNRSQRSKNEALALAMSFMPNDSVKIKELPARNNVYLVYFESKKLADSMPEAWHKLFWDGVKPGSFLLILNHEDDNPDAAFAVTVAAGNNVPFLSR